MKPMRRLLASLLLAAPLAATAARAEPLTPSTGISAWFLSGNATSGLRVAPTLALDGPRVSIVSGALLAGSERERTYRGAEVMSGLLLGPERLPLELRVTAAHREGSPVTRGLLRGEARIHFHDGRRGAWMGAAGEVGEPGLEAGDWGAPFVGMGAWARQHRMTLFVDLEQRVGLLPAPSSSRPDTTVVTEPSRDALPRGWSPQQQRVTLTTTKATLRWEGQRVELESVAGVTLSLVREPRRWAQARAALRLAEDFAVFATVGNRASESYLIEPAESPSATLGLRFAHWRQSQPDRPLVARASAMEWRVRSLGRGEAAIAVRAPGARLVEVMGDFTEWQPLRLARSGGELWECAVSLAPGLHHVALRVDGGEWMAPPGVPTAQDAYNGTVGMLIAE